MDLIQRAIDFFGTTDDPNEAGYILPDGRMLDFSGRHSAPGYKDKKPLPGKPDYLAGERVIDHRQVAHLFDKAISGTDAMIQFENAGNIRFGLTDGDLNISLATIQHPTQAQIQKISWIQRDTGGNIYYDIYDKNHDLVDSGEVFRVSELMRKFEEQLTPSFEIKYEDSDACWAAIKDAADTLQEKCVNIKY